MFPRISCNVLARVANNLRTVNQIEAVRHLHVTQAWVKAASTGFNRIAPHHQLTRSESSSSTTTTDWKKLKNEDWAERLTPEAYFCTREGGTEPPFSGQYVNHKAEGVYKCVCCGSDLFTSKTKYDSRSGWPSFHSPADDGAVIKRKDISHGMVRIEVICSNCNSHLGHVFDDGPEPSGQRYCINSVCLKFAPKKIN